MTCKYPLHTIDGVYQILMYHTIMAIYLTMVKDRDIEFILLWSKIAILNLQR